MKTLAEIEAQLATLPEAPPDNMSAATWFNVNAERARLTAERDEAAKAAKAEAEAAKPEETK